MIPHWSIFFVAGHVTLLVKRYSEISVTNSCRRATCHDLYHFASISYLLTVWPCTAEHRQKWQGLTDNSAPSRTLKPVLYQRAHLLTPYEQHPIEISRLRLYNQVCEHSIWISRSTDICRQTLTHPQRFAFAKFRIRTFFRVTGPMWGEFIGHRWIPLTKASDAELRCFLWSAPEQTVE